MFFLNSINNTKQRIPPHLCGGQYAIIKRGSRPKKTIYFIGYRVITVYKIKGSPDYITDGATSKEREQMKVPQTYYTTNQFIFKGA